MSNRAGVAGGAFALATDIFAKDIVFVLLSGASHVDITAGLPEGGTMGCTTYTLQPDTLVTELLEAGWGYGVDAVVPAAWAKHRWSGEGCPVPWLVEWIRDRLRANAELPASEVLADYSYLEASAALWI